MFHHLSKKSFCKEFAGTEVILIGRDIGPMRCFEALIKDFPDNQKFSFYTQGSALNVYFKKIVNQFDFEIIGVTKLIWKMVICDSCRIIILQSSYVSIIEKMVQFLRKQIYVIQDFKDDYKFGKNVTYVTAFESIPNDQYTETDILVIPNLRPKINNNVANQEIKSESLLIIGAKDLFSSDENILFLDRLLKYRTAKCLNFYYKPHPAENTDDYGSYFFQSRQIKVITELPINNFWPEYIVSPHSSLGYDIPEQVQFNKVKKFRVLHSFGEAYDKMIFAYPGFHMMFSNKAKNYLLKEINDFFG